MLSPCLFLGDPMNCSMQASLSFVISQSLLKLISIESVMLSNHLILCHCLLLLPSIFPSTKVFSNEVAKILELQFQHQSLQCIVRTDFLYVWLIWSLCCPRDSQELSSTPQFKNLWHSAFFMIQHSHPYMTTGRTIALIKWNFVGKVMSPFFNVLSMFAIAFIPRSKCL